MAVIPKNIIFFDGVCKLCNRTVDFVMRHNKGNKLYYASLQSAFAREFLKRSEISMTELNTICYFHDSRFYYKSTAVLKIMKELNGLYPVFSALLIIPPCIRDPLYDLIARNRYLVFGKRESCRVPSLKEQTYFIERPDDI